MALARGGLDPHSEFEWYPAASPGQIYTIEYAYLDGTEGPQMLTREGREIDGMEIKCRLDFGAGVIDWRNPCKYGGTAS